MGDILTLPAEQFEAGTEGTFAIPSAVYHDYALAPGINRGLIVELLQISPAHAQSILTGAYKKKVTKQMQGGSFVDMALLEPDLFKEGVSHWTIPAGMNLTTKEGRAWKLDHPALPYLPAVSDAGNVVSAENIKGMIESLMASLKIRRVVEESVKQESAFAVDPATGLMRKVRPDGRMVDNSSRLVLADLKSTFRGGATTEAWRNHCARMAYHIQAHYYSKVYHDLAGEMPFFIFIVVERKPPYAVRIFQLDPEGMEVGRRRCDYALATFRKCMDSGIWPAFNDEIETISLPRWELAAPEPEPIDL